MDIQSLGIQDADCLAEIHHQGFLFDEAWSAKSISEMLRLERTVGFAYRMETDILGFAVLTPGFDDIELATIVTKPAAQNQGVASALLAHLIDYSRHTGFERLLLEVAEDNLIAENLYRKHGFKTDGKRPNYYRRANGVRVNAILMSLELKG